MKFKWISFAFLALIIVIENGVNAQTTPTYKCRTTGTRCLFQNIRRTKSNYVWNPTADNPSSIRQVSFSGCLLQVVTKNVCERFASITNLQMYGQGIEIIEENAFDSCTSLENLDLSSNRIQKFAPQTFYNLPKLKVLHAYKNRITDFDYYAFDRLPNLVELSFWSNNLTEFPPELIFFNHKFSSLHIYSNDLSDLNVEKMLEYVPGIRTIVPDDNEFSCVRAVEIYNFLREKKINYDFKPSNKVRYYPQSRVFGGFKCNPDISWMASNYRKQNYYKNRSSVNNEQNLVLKTRGKV